MKTSKRTKKTKSLNRGKKLEKTRPPLTITLTEVFVTSTPISGHGGDAPPPPPPNK